MITLSEKGKYKLVETKHHTRVLWLEQTAYAWDYSSGLPKLTLVTRKQHKTDCTLSTGHYRLYVSHDEVGLSDQVHLELDVGLGHWQGYLLLPGLPVENRPSSRVIPTAEVITGIHDFALQ